ncbi:MAG: GAF and ANTAR domain-containing protein [Jiangellaceae bacterium]
MGREIHFVVSPPGLPASWGAERAMYDESLLVETLSGFAKTLLVPYDVDAVLEELTEHVTAVLGLVGSGVTLVRDGQLQFANAVNDAVVELEQAQHEYQRGPCLDAIRESEIVAIVDLRQQRERWPEYVAVADQHGVCSVAGIPLTLANRAVGALNLYAARPRDWSAKDLLAARVLADMATGYLVNASKLDQQRQLNEQLQRALEHRLVIEQAKGITAHAHNATVDVAFAMIRRHARNHNTSIQTIAEAIVTAGLRV